MRILTTALSLLAGLGTFNPNVVAYQGHGKPAPRRSTFGARMKEAWREANPGVSLYMYRYMKRYSSPGPMRTKFPFSAKRG